MVQGVLEVLLLLLLFSAAASTPLQRKLKRWSHQISGSSQDSYRISSMAEQLEEQPELMVISSDTATAHLVAHSSSESTSARSTSNKKQSLVLSYFRESATHSVDKEAICNKCKAKVSTYGNTTNMVKVSTALTSYS